MAFILGLTKIALEENIPFISQQYSKKNNIPELEALCFDCYITEYG